MEPVSSACPAPDPSRPKEKAKAVAAHFRKVHTKRPHVQPVQKTRKAFSESAQTLVHELQVHKVRLEIRHGVRQFCKLRLQRVERETAALRSTVPIVL